MNISWNGFGSFTITGKPLDGEVTLATDPYQGTLGLRFPRTLKASIAVRSHDGDYANNIDAIGPEGDNRMFKITHAGEYEVRGIFVKGITAPKKDEPSHTIYKITLEDVRIGFLGGLDRKLKDVELEALGEIDVLIVPAGGKSVMDSSIASEVVSQVEPRLVIPSYIDVKGAKEKFADVKDFCKEIGCASEEVNKAKISKSTLPQEDMKMMILSRS
ncbi:MBL fold metallo-hydrolase [Candidatus Uhrbacteria bacterium]|jgi:hypothetical protein|nr:MBL fold metallo-hydrolase [Candidatus Uhrbacteria bacterium]MBT7717053.1 MBL fold metallo-hydrolase [Candidatus Uhrbacteria bacterium]